MTVHIELGHHFHKSSEVKRKLIKISRKNEFCLTERKKFNPDMIRVKKLSDAYQE